MRDALPAVLVLLLVAPGCGGFLSVPPGADIHTEITMDAADRAGWPQGGRDALAAAVRAPDFQDMAWDPDLDDPTGIRMTDQYMPAHHCDRRLPAGNETAFASAQAFIADMRDAALDGHDATATTQAVGRGLHALQDCFSHSDFVDLAPEDQAAFTAALLDGAPPPGSFRITAVDPDHEPTGHPPDPYPHDLFAKDGPDANDEAQAMLPDGRTKHEAARQAATDASARWLEEIVARLPPQRLEEIGELDAVPGQGLAGPFHVVWLVLVGSALLVATRGRP